MKFKIVTIAFTTICIIISLSCSKERSDGVKKNLCYCEDSIQGVSSLVLRENFSESEFREALIGKWESVFEHEGEENIMCLGLTKDHTAYIVLEKESVEKEFVGNYQVNFIRPPQQGFVTFGKITIFTSNDSIIFSRVNFGLHNAFSGDRWFLRFDESPYGVLDRFK